ncbi:hypothetical protein LJB94_00940 [Odoribacter sp. OttesenSCG-928-G04]|nr:hypothetical protein [Odoribacter sp. OttesenSCG-928-G04]
MKLLILMLLSLLLLSCEDKSSLIYYEYDGVTITRHDVGNKMYLYYGKCDDPNLSCRDSYIKAYYSGWNSGISAYLMFHKNGSIEISSSMGHFENINNNMNFVFFSEILSKDHINEPEIAKLYGKHYQLTWVDTLYGKAGTLIGDSLRAHYDNVVYISNILPIERKRNEARKTLVKCIYPEEK